MGELPFYEEAQYNHLRNTLKSFQFEDLSRVAFDFFFAIGYATDKQLPDLKITPNKLTSAFGCPRELKSNRAHLSEWKSIHFLFQLTANDFYETITNPKHRIPVGFPSILFFAIDLQKNIYDSKTLEDITWAINYSFVMPIFILFRYGNKIALGMTQKRPNKIHNELDVVEAVQVVDGIFYNHPDRIQMSFLHLMNFQTISFRFNINSLNGFYTYWWDQLSDFTNVKEHLHKEKLKSSLGIYFDDIRKYPLLTPEEEFWCLLKVNPLKYLVNDPGEFPRYGYLVFFKEVYIKFKAVWKKVTQKITKEKQALVLRLLISDAIALQKNTLVSELHNYKYIEKARSQNQSDLANLLLQTITTLYLLPYQKLMSMKELLDKGGIKSLPYILYDESIEPEWVKKAAQRLIIMKKASKTTLIQRNLRLVVKIAKKYQNQGLAFMDLISEGNFGLIRMIDKFNLNEETRFSTYAYWWIRQAVTRSIAEKGNLIRLPVHVHEDMYKVISMRDKLTQSLLREPTPEDIGLRLNLTEKTVGQLLLYAENRFLSLEQPVGDDGGSEFGDFIEDEDALEPMDAADRELLKDQVKNALAFLSDRERQVLELRFGLIDGKDHTLEEVSRYFNVTRERIRQIEAKALRKLRHPNRSHHLRDYLPSDSKYLTKVKRGTK